MWSLGLGASLLNLESEGLGQVWMWPPCSHGPQATLLAVCEARPWDPLPADWQPHEQALDSLTSSISPGLRQWTPCYQIQETGKTQLLAFLSLSTKEPISRPHPAGQKLPHFWVPGTLGDFAQNS